MFSEMVQFWWKLLPNPIVTLPNGRNWDARDRQLHFVVLNQDSDFFSIEPQWALMSPFWTTVAMLTRQTWFGNTGSWPTKLDVFLYINWAPVSPKVTKLDVFVYNNLGLLSYHWKKKSQLDLMETEGTEGRGMQIHFFLS